MSTLLAYIRCETTVSPETGVALDAPLIPASWEITIENSRWSTIYPLGRQHQAVFFHARLMLRHPSFPNRALFICTGPRLVLNRLTERIAADALPWTRTWLTLQQLRDDATTIAQQIRANWPDERPDGVGVLVAHWFRMAGLGIEDAES